MNKIRTKHFATLQGIVVSLSRFFLPILPTAGGLNLAFNDHLFKHCLSQLPYQKASPLMVLVGGIYTEEWVPTIQHDYTTSAQTSPLPIELQSLDKIALMLMEPMNNWLLIDE